MSCSMIWHIPARRPGASAQKSAIHRLWACRPAHLAWRSAAEVGGGWSVSEALGKKGGMVFGKTTSATTPSASSSASRRVLSQLRSASGPFRSS